MSLRFASVLSLALFGPAQEPLSYEGSHPLPVVAAKVDVGTILRTWRIKGVLPCPGTWNFGIWVENAWPCGILEVVRQTGKTHLAGVPNLFPPRMTSGHNEAGLQFADVRVYAFVLRYPGTTQIPLAIPGGPGFAVNYVSELDPAGWRAGLLDLLIDPDPRSVGAWGRASPRTGFVLQPSEPIAAHLQAVRAGRVAARPAGRIVLGRYPFEPRVGHHLQLIAPVTRPAVPIGHRDLASLERGATSPHGAYLFVHLGHFEAVWPCTPGRLLGPREPR